MTDHIQSVVEQFKAALGYPGSQQNVTTTILRDSQEPYLPLCLPKSNEDDQQRIELFYGTRPSEEPPLADVMQLVKAYYESDPTDNKSITALGLKPNWKDEQAVEIRQQLLSLTGLLSNITEDNTHAIYYLDTNVDGVLTYKSYMAKAQEIEGFFKTKAAEMRETGEKLRCRFLLRLRGDLAIIEIASAKAEEDCLVEAGYLDSVLVGMSSRYLGCPIIQTRLTKAKKLRRYGNTQQQIDGEAYIKQIELALRFNGSQNSKRRTSYWGIYELYHKILAECQGAQVQRLKGGSSFLDQLCNRYSLVKPKRGSIDDLKTLEKQIKALIILSGEFPDLSTLPPHLCFGEAKPGCGASTKTLDQILKLVPQWREEYRGYMDFPYIKFFDLPVQPGLNLLWLHEYQEMALDRLERVHL